MAGMQWTEAEDEWLRVEYPYHSNLDLAEIKEQDGWPRSAQSIMGRAQKLGLRKAPGFGHIQRPKFWTPEREAWFRSFVPGHTESEISAEHERLFGSPLTRSQIGNAKHKLGVRSGTVGGQFKKGSVPANKGRTWDEFMPPDSQERCRATQFAKGTVGGAAAERMRQLLDVRVDRDGYYQIKVSPRNARNPMRRWIPLGAFNWMAANGRDWPDGCRCCHIDGDPANCDADNIHPVPAELWPMVMGAVPGGLEYHDRETLETAILYARVTHARKRRQRDARVAAGRPWAQDIKEEK